MKKRAACINIDGELVQDGKLNPDLLETLKSENYDSIILVSHRSVYSQFWGAVRQFSGAKEAHFFYTPELVRVLATETGKPVRVSTAIDYIFGKPAEYYATTLCAFEESLKKTIDAQGQHFDRRFLQPQYHAESDQVREKMLTSSFEPSDFYPTDIRSQFENLTKALGEILPSDEEDDESVAIDYFDSNLANIRKLESLNYQEELRFHYLAPGGQMHTYSSAQTEARNANEPPSFLRRNTATITGGTGGAIGAGLLTAGLVLAFTPAGWGILAVAGVIAGAAVAGGLIGFGVGTAADWKVSGGGSDQPDTGINSNLWRDSRLAGTSKTKQAQAPEIFTGTPNPPGTDPKRSGPRSQDAEDSTLSSGSDDEDQPTLR